MGAWEAYARLDPLQGAPTPEYVCGFATWLAIRARERNPVTGYAMKALDPLSAKEYVSGVRSVFEADPAAPAFPPADNPILQRQFAALRRWKHMHCGAAPATKAHKAAVSPDMLPVLAQGTYALARAHMLTFRTAPILSQAELTHVHAVATCLCGFVLLARIGSELVPRPFNPVVHPTALSVTWVSLSTTPPANVTSAPLIQRIRMPRLAFRFKFNSLKQDQFLDKWNAASPPVERTHNVSCAVDALLLLETLHGRNGSEPLFKVSAEYVRAFMRERLTPLAPDGHRVTGHSLRYGGATALFAAGVRTDIIARLGRWSSAQMIDLYARVDTAAASAAIRAAITGRRVTPFATLATIGEPAVGHHA